MINFQFFSFFFRQSINSKSYENIFNVGILQKHKLRYSSQDKDQQIILKLDRFTSW